MPKTPPPFPFPVFRILDEDGHLRSDVDPSILSQNELYTNQEMMQKALLIMTRLRQMDDLLLNAQRQGRISFYMSCRGEEAIHVGAASALTTRTDPILAQYREQGLIMWRGFTLEQFTNQCYSNDLDLGKGRQMPVHYGSRALNYHTISSPLGTQIPQAVGVAYKLKLDNAKKKDVATEGGCAITIFGDGAASTGDFHAACNFAATLECPIIFFCRNNGYAISTSVKDQYRGDGVIGRAPGYGMAAIRVDGNDLFAVHSATKLARDYAIQNNQPVMIEAMTYRGGHHSTSDDSTRYRSKDEVKYWTTENDPLTRLLHFCQKNGKENAFSEQTKISDEERMAVRKALEKAESRQGPKISTLFEDVYSKVPSLLQRQEAEHMEHIKKYPEFYQDRD
jgi:2-oxoisovalerate dehydrogenase E1 component alpha subunit